MGNLSHTLATTFRKVNAMFIRTESYTLILDPTDPRLPLAKGESIDVHGSHWLVMGINEYQLDSSTSVYHLDLFASEAGYSTAQFGPGEYSTGHIDLGIFTDWESYYDDPSGLGLVYDY